MKALTVQQPLAWAIIHGGKDIENRTQRWSYRGLLAIHAGIRWSERGQWSELVSRACLDFYGTRSPLHDHKRFNSNESPGVVGAIIGTVDLVDVHHQHDDCCDSPWAETSYTEHGGRTRRQLTHLVLENPRPLATPLPCQGALGLWTPDTDILAELAQELEAAR